MDVKWKHTEILSINLILAPSILPSLIDPAPRVEEVADTRDPGLLITRERDR